MSRFSKLLRKAERTVRTHVIHKIVPKPVQHLGNKILNPIKKIARTVNAPFKVLANVTDNLFKRKEQEIQFEEN